MATKNKIAIQAIRSYKFKQKTKLFFDDLNSILSTFKVQS